MQLYSQVFFISTTRIHLSLRAFAFNYRIGLRSSQKFRSLFIQTFSMGPGASER